MKLPLTTSEKKLFQDHKMSQNKIVDYSAKMLNTILGLNIERCKKLLGIASLQKLGSVGPAMAEKIYDLGYHSLESLVGIDPTKMYHDYSRKVGGYADPCVEDVFRCAIAQAQYPDLKEELKDWWQWTSERGNPFVVLFKIQ